MYKPDFGTFPIPLEYIDVFRFSHTTVVGFERVVDCWVHDDNQRIPGPLGGPNLLQSSSSLSETGMGRARRPAHNK